MMSEQNMPPPFIYIKKKINILNEVAFKREKQ